MNPAAIYEGIVPKICFGTYTLDTVNQCLVSGLREIFLTPKAYAVLRHLVNHANRLVTKDELLDAIWPDAFVEEAVVTVCICEIRKALGDSRNAPQYIQTLHRRGYRFIAATAQLPSQRERFVN